MGLWQPLLHQNKVKSTFIREEKGLGRKLKISGGGRCNVTNRLPYSEIIKISLVMENFYIAPFQCLIMNR